MSLNHLHAALDRAKDRHLYAKRNLDRARAELTPARPDARSLRKIEGDLIAAERDLAYPQHALEQGREVEGLNL